MALPEEVLCFEYLAKTRSFSIHNEKHYYDDDGIYIASRRHTTGFAPGEIDKVKSWLKDANHPIASYIDSIWTPQVVDDFQKKAAESRAEIENGSL